MMLMILMMTMTIMMIVSNNFLTFTSICMLMIMDVIWYTAILYGLSTTSSYNQKGFTAMIMAAVMGHKDIVEYLVSQGADKDIKNNVSTNLIHAHAPSLMYVCIHTWISYIYMYMYVYINMYVYDIWLVLCLVISYLHASYTVVHTHLHVHVYRYLIVSYLHECMSNQMIKDMNIHLHTNIYPYTHLHKYVCLSLMLMFLLFH